MPELAEKEKLKVNYEELFKKLKMSLKDLYGENCVERTDKTITKKGYDTTGYGYQFVVNRLNEVLPKYGLHWTTQDDIKLLKEYPSTSGRINYEYAGKLTLLFLDDARNALDARACYGGHQSSTHADAMKGAFTNAFKKTAALFGVGADAYEGTIDEDYRPVEEPAVDPVTVANSAIQLTLPELKAIEKEMTAIAGITTKEEVKTVGEAITALVGKVSGKQINYLRKLLENKEKELGKK
jgi:hypothetical protein